MFIKVVQHSIVKQVANSALQKTSESKTKAFLSPRRLGGRRLGLRLGQRGPRLVQQRHDAVLADGAQLVGGLAHRLVAEVSHEAGDGLLRGLPHLGRPSRGEL